MTTRPRTRPDEARALPMPTRAPSPCRSRRPSWLFHSFRSLPASPPSSAQPTDHRRERRRERRRHELQIRDARSTHTERSPPSSSSAPSKSSPRSRSSSTTPMPTRSPARAAVSGLPVLDVVLGNTLPSLVNDLASWQPSPYSPVPATAMVGCRGGGGDSLPRTHGDRGGGLWKARRVQRFPPSVMSARGWAPSRDPQPHYSLAGSPAPFPGALK
jgi:hypothetical protein